MTFYSITAALPVTTLPPGAKHALHASLSRYCDRVSLEYVDNTQTVLEILAMGDVHFDDVELVDSTLRDFCRKYAAEAAPFTSLDGAGPTQWVEYYGRDPIAEEKARKHHLQKQIAELEEQLAVCMNISICDVLKKYMLIEKPHPRVVK